MVVFSPPLPDHAQVGDPGHISDHNALLEAAKTLNSGKIDYSHHTAKGTLVSASAANVPGTLTVGTDDMVLLVDSSQTLGLKWAQLPTGGITDSAVTTAKIADGSVTTAKIANDAVTTAKIAADAVTSDELADNAVDTNAIQDNAVTSAKIAANAVGASELADNAVDTAAIADSAVTSAKIADGTITSTDVAESTFAAFGTVGNLLTSNQASVETDSSPFGAFLNCTISRSTDHAAHGSACLKAIATAEGQVIAGLDVTTVPVTPGETITGTFALKADRNLAAVRVAIQWATGGVAGGIAYRTVSATTAWVTHSLTEVVPAGVDTAGLFAWVTSAAPAGSEIYMDCFGIWKGAGGVWAMPGTPIIGKSEVASNGAVHLSGTGSPQGVIIAAPGSTWLQTDSTTDVNGWIRWVKASGTGTTGWVAGPEADTGWRNVSALYDGAVVSGGVITVRRIGDLVEMRMLVGWAQSTTTTGLTVLTLPSGFRPPANDYQTFQGRNFAGRGTPAGFLGSNHLIQANGAVSVYGCTATVTITADPKWVTGDAWPSSLPGSAA